MKQKTEGELHETRIQLDEMETAFKEYASKLSSNYDRLLSLERHSRESNLRFFEIAETSKEDCIEKLKDILNANLSLHPQIENAHRIAGQRNDGKPRPIIAKFLHLPERHQIFITRKASQRGVDLGISNMARQTNQPKKGFKSIFSVFFFSHSISIFCLNIFFIVSFPPFVK